MQIVFCFVLFYRQLRHIGINLLFYIPCPLIIKRMDLTLIKNNCIILLKGLVSTFSSLSCTHHSYEALTILCYSFILTKKASVLFYAERHGLVNISFTFSNLSHMGCIGSARGCIGNPRESHSNLGRIHFFQIRF